jgi:hypothetical protein
MNKINDNRFNTTDENVKRLPRISTDTSKTNYTSGSKSLKITYLRK